MPSARRPAPEPYGPPPGHPSRDPAVEYARPTPGLVAELFRHPAEGDRLDAVRPDGVAAIRWTREVRLGTIVDRMVGRISWAAAGAVLLRDGRPCGYESYPGGLSEEFRLDLELLPTLGLVVWVDRNCWRCDRGYRVRADLPPARTTGSVSEISPDRIMS